MSLPLLRSNRAATELGRSRPSALRYEPRVVFGWQGSGVGFASLQSGRTPANHTFGAPMRPLSVAIELAGGGVVRKERSRFNYLA